MSRGVAAPGSCSPVSARPKTGPWASVSLVGRSISSPMPPRRGWPGTGGDASMVIEVATRMRPPAEPSSSGCVTGGPPSFCARNSGTASVVAETGSVVVTRRPRPMCRPSLWPSSTVIATASGGSSMATMGSQMTPASLLRSAPPRASSTKAISAARCASLASMFLSESSGWANQFWLGLPAASNRPSAFARLPSTPRSLLAKLIA